MGGMALGGYLVAWATVFLPYSLCCLYPIYKKSPTLPLAVKGVIAAFFAISLTVWMLIGRYAAQHWIMLLGMLALLLLGDVLLSLYRGIPFVFLFYCAIGGTNVSVGLLLLMMELWESGWMSPVFIISGGLLLSLALANVCRHALKKIVLPYQGQIANGKHSLFDGSPGLYLCLMLLFNFHRVSMDHPEHNLAVYFICLWGTYWAYSKNARLMNQVLYNADFVRRNSILEHCIQLQQTQYAALEEQVAQTRAARHDLRHHQRVMEQYIRDGDKTRLEEYLAEFRERVDLCRQQPGVCAHPAADALVRYYLGLIQQTGARLDIALDIREDVPVAAYDLCIVLGNCLENALEAIRETQPQQRFLRMRAEQNDDMLTIVAGNSYQRQRLEQGDEFLSTKRPGEPGIGLSSIRTVTEKYGGSCKIEAKDGVFKISMIFFAKGENAAC